MHKQTEQNGKKKKYRTCPFFISGCLLSCLLPFFVSIFSLEFEFGPWQVTVIVERVFLSYAKSRKQHLLIAALKVIKVPRETKFLKGTGQTKEIPFAGYVKLPTKYHGWGLFIIHYFFICLFLCVCMFVCWVVGFQMERSTETDGSSCAFLFLRALTVYVYRNIYIHIYI